MNLPIQLDRASPVPLQDQLFEQLRQLIVSGKIKPQSRIIATRFLAEQVGVSRTTVLLAYEKLISEGYLKTQPTVGTFVSDVLPDGYIHRVPPVRSDTFRQARLRPSVFKSLLSPPADAAPTQIDFCRVFPDSSLLPSKLWQRRAQHVVDRYGAGAAEPLPPEGLEVLRLTLADWLAARRGISVKPEQIVIVAGLRQAYAIISHLFQRRGDHVVVESPGNEDLLRFLESRSAALVPVAVDHQGLRTDVLPEGAPISLACVTPACQNPVGGTLPLYRRQQLIDWARTTGAYIIEDATDNDIRYQEAAPLPLAALDSYGLVFHVGSFSKTLGAGLCLGYVVAPAEFSGPVRAIKAMSDDGCPWIEQMVLADFIASGTYDHHLRRLRRALMARRDCLIEALESHFGPVELASVDGGTQVTWILPPAFPPARIVRDLARSEGVHVYALTEEKQPSVPAHVYGDRALVLSYAALTERQIRDGIAGLARAVAAHASRTFSAA